MDSKFTLAFFLFLFSFQAHAQSESSANTVYVPLPLVWDNIRVVKNNEGNNIITWWTLPEYHIVEFIIQRSDDGHVFKAFKRIGANKGSETYQAEDIAKENEFYRIISIDNVGKASYSKVVNIKGKNNAAFIFYNGRNGLQIQSGVNNAESVRLTDISGRTFIYSKNAVQNGYVDISNVPRGIYIVDVPGTNIQTSRFMKL